MVALCGWYWRASAVLTGVGVGLVTSQWSTTEPLFMLGLALIVGGLSVANTGYIAMRARSLDEEFDAGYRVGYRAGRRAPHLAPVTPIRRVAGGLSEFSKVVANGGLPKAPIGSVAGHGSAPRRTEAHAD